MATHVDCVENRVLLYTEIIENRMNDGVLIEFECLYTQEGHRSTSEELDVIKEQ